MARFVNTARFVPKVTKRVKLDALPARFVTAAHVTCCHYVVTKHAERSTRCTFCHSFASNTVTCLFLSSLCVCVCVCACTLTCVSLCVCHVRMCVCTHARTCTCVCVLMCICLWQRARPCMYCLEFIIPASISAKLKFCIALSRLRGYCCP